MYINKLVSVIIPTYKGSDTIGRALDSLCLQTFKDFEVVIVDDNGKNTSEQIKTEAVIKKYQTKLLIQYVPHEKNKNGAAARNTGFKKSNGKYICFLDDDDIYLRKRIENAIVNIEKYKCDFLFCSVLIQRNGKLVQIIKPKINSDVQKELLLNTGLFGTGSNIFLRKEVYLNVGGFNEQYYRRQDNEFLLRALENHSYGIIELLDIVKINNGVNNIPSYNKLYLSNEKYFSDFDYVIKKLSDEELNEFFANQYSWLFFCCLMKENKENIEKAKFHLLKYRSLTKKERVQEFLSTIHIGSFTMLQIMQPIMSKTKNYFNRKKIISELNLELVNELRQFNLFI